jgi:16S rRNA (cytidine1402-2'-O)-methyltransferase
METKPTLYMVATPIGNLEDITYRAVRVLGEVGAIFAEDTRVSRVLLQRYSITSPIYSYREAAPRNVVEKSIESVLKLLAEGKSVAYISDAGTPAVSDPGSYLVKRVTEAGYEVSPIPGASALPMIVSVSGLPIIRPLFVGFLPRKKGKQTLLAKLQATLSEDVADAVIFYESPERVASLLESLRAWETSLQIVIGRELTKKFEEVVRGNLEEVSAYFSVSTKKRGEFVVLVARTGNEGKDSLE